MKKIQKKLENNESEKKKKKIVVNVEITKIKSI